MTKILLALFSCLLICFPADSAQGRVLIATTDNSQEEPDRTQELEFLPDPSKKLVLDLSDYKVYLLNRDGQEEASYPVAIGKKGWETPVGHFQVIQMEYDPAWEHPHTGQIVPPGKNNPLGRRWIGFYVSNNKYLGFHGTPNESLLGRPVSHGCVRMRNEDIVKLFEQVSIGTSVQVRP